MPDFCSTHFRVILMSVFLLSIRIVKTAFLNWNSTQALVRISFVMEVSLLHLIGFSHLRQQNKHEGIKWKVNYPRPPSLLEGTGQKQSDERACQPRLPLRMNRLVLSPPVFGTNLACFSKHLQKSGKWREQANDLKKKEFFSALTLRIA